MLLIAITQILFWTFIGLLILTVILSLKGILSPKFTLLLFLFLGGAALLCNSLSSSRSQILIPTDPLRVLEDTSETVAFQQNDGPSVKPHKPPNKISTTKPPKIKEQEDESKVIQNEVIETNDNPVIENSIPQEYEVTDVKLRTYKIKGSLGLGKPFMKYFEEQTGWKKTKKGNSEFEITHLGNFKQENKANKRMYIYSGGEVKIKVNGSLCCCGAIFSIPEGISDSKLVKARGKLKQSISDLMFEHKESVVKELQKCL